MTKTSPKDEATPKALPAEEKGGARCQFCDDDTCTACGTKKGTLRAALNRETELRRKAEAHNTELRAALDVHPYPDEYEAEKARADKAEARVERLEKALREIADSPTDDDEMLDLWTIARRALEEAKP